MSQYSPNLRANLPRARLAGDLGTPFNNYTTGDRRASVDNIWASPGIAHRRFSIDFGFLTPEAPATFSDPFVLQRDCRMMPAASAPLWAVPGDVWAEQGRAPSITEASMCGDRFAPFEQHSFVPRRSTGELFQPISLSPTWCDHLGEMDENHGEVEWKREKNGHFLKSIREGSTYKEGTYKESTYREGTYKESGGIENPEAQGTVGKAECDTADLSGRWKNGVSAVDEYFSLDPHRRVKVTAEYLQQRFSDEEKYLDLYELPKFPPNARERRLVLVGFKAGRVDLFYLLEAIAWHSLKEGDLVMVEADRGKDLGKILKFDVTPEQARLLKLLESLEQQAALNEHSVDDLSLKQLQHEMHLSHNGGGAPPALHAPKAVLSLAQAQDVQQILAKKHDEEKACRVCLSKLTLATTSHEHGDHAVVSDLSHMKLIDAEYQFDRRKLIFYYSTTKRIDFRDLVRELFRIFKTRIWMCAVSGAPVALKQKHKYKNGDVKLDYCRGGGLSSPQSRHSSVSCTKFPKADVWHGIPRQFGDDLSAEEPWVPDGDESLVLKSLVDTLDR